MKSRRRSYLKLGVALLLALAAFALLYFGMKFLEGKMFGAEEEGIVQDSFGQITFEGKTYKPKTQMSTMLVIGLDTYTAGTEDERGDAMSDFLALVAFDKNEETYKIIHINRDTMVDMNVLGLAGEKVSTVNQQLALAHTYGSGDKVSCRNVADAVSKLLLNAKINNYASITMDAVPLYNDLVGGVELTVLDDFTGIDDTLVKGQTVKLTGEQALKYVQSRKGVADSSNENRMARQKQYLEALYATTNENIKSNDKFVIDATLKLSEYMVSNCSVAQFQNIFEKISKYDFTEIKYLDGEMKSGERFMEFYPSEESIKKQVVDLFYTKK